MKQRWATRCQKCIKHQLLCTARCALRRKKKTRGKPLKLCTLPSLPHTLPKHSHALCYLWMHRRSSKWELEAATGSHVFGIWEMYHWINPPKNTAVELELSLICTRLKVGENCKPCIWISSLLTTPNWRQILGSPPFNCSQLNLRKLVQLHVYLYKQCIPVEGCACVSKDKHNHMKVWKISWYFLGLRQLYCIHSVYHPMDCELHWIWSSVSILFFS